MDSPPAALLKIEPLPLGLIEVLRELANDPDPGAAVRAIVGADPKWKGEVESIRWYLFQSPFAEGKAEKVDAAYCEIAVAASVHRYLQSALESDEVSRYWRYILACGLVCRGLAQSLNVQPALAFSCGLLHDLGRLALMVAYPTRYANILSASEHSFGRKELYNVPVQERLLFGFDRFETGEWLVEKWDLPPFLRQITGKFQSPENVTEFDIVSLTRVGCSLTYALGYGLLLGAPRKSLEEFQAELALPIENDLGENFCLLRKSTDAILEQWNQLLF